VRRADLEIAGAVASVLGVGLGDLFDVHAVAVGALGEEPDVLGPATARRLAELFDISSRGELSADERRQLETLVREYGLQLHEMRVQEYARQQHLSPDEARREVASSLERSVAWWEEFEADPDQRAVIVRDAKRRRQPASKT
jgi:hypothetical protein